MIMVIEPKSFELSPCLFLYALVLMSHSSSNTAAAEL